jgi:serine phosphatase RsbU (regulator of sigma subunit)
VKLEFKIYDSGHQLWAQLVGDEEIRTSGEDERELLESIALLIHEWLGIEKEACVVTNEVELEHGDTLILYLDEVTH